MSFYPRRLFISKRKKVLKGFLLGASLFLLGALSLYFVSAIAQFYLPTDWLSNPFIPVFLMALITIVAYKPLDFFFSELFEKYLFKKRSFVHIVLMNLAEELELVLDLQELANLVVNTFGEVLHLKTVALLVPERQDGVFQISAAFGWNISDYRRVQVAQDAALMSLIRSSGPHVLVRNRVVRALDWRDANRLAHDFDLLRASWIIPLMVKEKLVGLLAFSAQEPERTFDEADFQFFRKFAHSAARKIFNALRFLELERAHAELQDVQSRSIQATKLTAIEQLATGLAHQIHNPLTIISGKAQVLLLQKDRMELDERVHQVLTTIVKQTKRAADITKKLLMFSQGSGVAKEWLHLDQVLEDTLSLISYQTSLEAIELTKTIGPNLPVFYANVQEIREVFFNLILNAVQAIGSGGKVHVALGYQEKERVVEIQISDTGRGIEKDNVDKLFNPFFTTRHDGLGLGLFVAKQIVHRYDGSIRVESRAGEGSLFIVRLPYAEHAAMTGTSVQTSFPAESRHLT